MSPQGLVSISTACDQLDCSPALIGRLLLSGRLPGLRLSGEIGPWRLEMATLTDYLRPVVREVKDVREVRDAQVPAALSPALSC